MASNMKNIFTIVLLASTLIAKSQTSIYHPFPDSNAIWNVHHAYGEGLYDCYSYFINGDTMINSLPYHKIYVSGYEQGFYWCFGGTLTLNRYCGAFRQDKNFRKVYMVQPDSSTEVIYFDFSVSKSDSVVVLYGYPTSVFDVDSIVIDGNYRKELIIPSLDFPEEIIEGIGSSIGGFFPHSIQVENDWWLECFDQDGEMLYGFGPCTIYNGINEQKPDQPVSLYPNPVNDKLNLLIKESGKMNLSIYDLTSRCILKKEVSNSAQINTSQLSNGIYIYKLQNEKGILSTGKIIKE